jgi:tetratricopeptide (TPR) repeat protein
VLFILGAVFLVYWPAQRNGFVWDDTALVLRDPLIRSWRLIPESFRHFLFLDATGSDFYRPLQRLTFLADYAAWGFNPRGYHLTNIYLHLAASVALYFLAATVLPTRHRPLYALGLAVLWAVHPMHTSAVTYIAGRADPLAALLGFSALALACQALRTPEGRRRSWLEWAAALGFLGALLSKESGFFAPALWIGVLVAKQAPRKTWIRWALLVTAVFAIYGTLRFSAQKLAPTDRQDAPTESRGVLAARSWAESLQVFAWPDGLHMERSVAAPAHPTPGEIQSLRVKTLLGLALAAAFSVWAAWGWRNRRPSALALGALAATFLPCSNLLRLNATFAEHWFYIPSAFLLLAVAASWEPLFSRLGKKWEISAALLLAGWGVFLGTTTRAQQIYWLDPRTFLTKTLERGGQTARIHVNLGNLEISEKRLDQAAAEFDRALDLEPGLPFALMGRAYVEARRGNNTEALALLEKGGRDPFFKPDCLLLEAAMAAPRSSARALDLLEKAATLAPDRWPIRRRHLEALEKSGQRDETIRRLRLELNTEPFRAETWSWLGDLLAQTQKTEESQAAFQRATELDVHDNESRERIGIIRRIQRQQQATGSP